MNEQFVNLDELRDNPYQPRMTDNAEHIENLARSIAADDLQQYPKARGVALSSAAGYYELAFGHSRRKAFAWLREHYAAQGLTARYQGYTAMPVFVETISDEDMYRFAIAENVQRKDLDAIEQARAMKRYAVEFGKTSKEIGELFGMRDATVRGKIRLLDLPEIVTAELAQGTISEGAARALLTLQRMDADMLPEALEAIKGGDDPEEEVEYRIRDSKKTKFISDDNFSTTEKRFKHLPGYDDIAQLRADIGDEPVITDDELRAWTADAKKAKKTLPDDHPAYLKLFHLIHPPACTACAHYAVVDSLHVCGWIACYQRKHVAVARERFLKIVADSGIAELAEIAPEAVKLERRMDNHEELVRQRHADLRLVFAPELFRETWKCFDGFESCIVVAVGALAQQLEAEEAKLKAANKKSRYVYEESDAQKSQRETERIERLVRDVTLEELEHFRAQVVALRFVSLFDGIKSTAFLNDLYKGMDNSSEHYPGDLALQQLAPKAASTAIRRALADVMCIEAEQHGYDLLSKSHLAKQPASAYAKIVEPAAAAWGVKLGKDWPAVVKAWDATINTARRVAVETGRSK